MSLAESNKCRITEEGIGLNEDHMWEGVEKDNSLPLSREIHVFSNRRKKLEGQLANPVYEKSSS